MVTGNLISEGGNSLNRIKTFYLERERALLGLLFICCLLVLWETLARLDVINPFFISYPSKIMESLFQQTVNGSLFQNLLATMLEFVIAFSIAAVVGLVLGFFMGWYRLVEYTVDPFMWLLYSAPLISLYPLLVIWLGLGIKIAVTLGFLFAFVSITANTLAGIKEVDRTLIRAARSFGASNRVIFFRIMVPAALPMIISGLRLGVGRALIGIIAAEMFSANRGLGYAISYYGNQMKTADFFAALLVVVVIGIVFDQVLKAVELGFSRWKAGN